jgi:hypothetical protein
VPVDTALALLREIAAGAAVLHDNGIVHRDLTPGNVLFKSRPAGPASGQGEPGSEPGTVGLEQVLIADLGLAKAFAAASGLTARAGTPGYMAPEQDDPLAIVDARTDVFGLGRLGAVLLGAPAAGRPTELRLRAGVPASVADVLRKATARQPADRYPHARAFGAALDRATTAAGSGGPVIRVRRPGSATRRRRRAVLAVMVLAVVVGTAAADGESAGRISVILPDGWHTFGSVWAGQREPDGRRAPALVISPNPKRWGPSDPTVPGAFIGLSRAIAENSTPAEFIAAKPHPGCIARPVRTTRQAGIDWVIAEFTSCRSGMPTIVEAAGIAPAGAGLVYVEIRPSAGSASSFVDTLLAGVRVRG